MFAFRVDHFIPEVNPQCRNPGQQPFHKGFGVHESATFGVGGPIVFGLQSTKSTERNSPFSDCINKIPSYFVASSGFLRQEKDTFLLATKQIAFLGGTLRHK